MTLRSTSLPFLPGFNFNGNLGKTKFPRDCIMVYNEGVRMLTDKLDRSKLNLKYPSVYTRGEVSELPGWINYDNKILTFDCYFQETLQETYKIPNIIRVCKLYFYLEDGTVKVNEPKVINSGMPQGVLINRGRIPMPPPKDHIFYDLLDFNIGREIELYGRVFKITNCDPFTRNFLNRLGISVPDPIVMPEDPYTRQKREEKEVIFSKKPNKHIDTLGQFLQNDGHVLRFYGYWDDRKTEGGYVHDLIILFYLADDTIQIMEKETNSHGEHNTFMFLKRGKLPKFYNELPTPGYYDETTVLNALCSKTRKKYYIHIDPLNAGKEDKIFYGVTDFAIGASIIAYGRKIFITDCDPYTREIYRKKYGLDAFIPLETPKIKEEKTGVPIHKRKLPPWNGYGSYEDSAQNCVTVELKKSKGNLEQFLKYSRDGIDSHTLRFKARMQCKLPPNCKRIFVIAYYLSDNSIAIFELKSGTQNGGIFLARSPIKMPYQENFTSEPPDFYQPQHFFIGATVILNSFHFVVIDADEYALRHMELHSDEYPKSNIKLIMDKIRKKIKPIYKDFVDELMPKDQPVISFDLLRKKLCPITGTDWTEHEMVTLARHFSSVCSAEKKNRAFIRKVVLTELKKRLWDDLQRLNEHFRDWDHCRTGYLPRKDVYTLIRACKVPLDRELIENMLNVLNKNENCEIEGQDLFNFMDRNYCPTSDTIPLNVKKEMWFEEPIATAGRLIDWCAFNKELKLEYLFREPIVISKEEN